MRVVTPSSKQPNDIKCETAKRMHTQKESANPDRRQLRRAGAWLCGKICCTHHRGGGSSGDCPACCVILRQQGLLNVPYSFMASCPFPQNRHMLSTSSHVLLFDTELLFVAAY